MNETQLLTLMLVIKKIKKEVKKQGNSFLLIADDIKELDKRIKQIPLEETKKELKNNIKTLEDSVKTILSGHTQELDNKMTDYTTQRENALNDLKMSLKDIEKTLSSFVTKDEFKQFNKQIDDKLKTIPKNVEVEIGEVKTLDPGEEAKVEVVKTDTSYKLNFYIPRGVSGRGMPGKGVPSGGTTNQVLAKNSNDDYDTKWVTGGSGGTSDHSELTNLDYASAGHTGFQPAGDYVEDASYVHTDNNFTDAFETKLTGIEAGAEVNVNADWNATTGDAQILNKPTIPAAQIQSDWTQATNTAVDYIKNKPTIPAAQIQSDWTQATNTEVDYIKNKPTITDEKVKYDASDSTAGYIADKVIAGTGISVAEGTGANENKLVITNSNPTAYTLPTASASVLGGVKIDGSTITISDGVISAVTGGSGDVTGPASAGADNIAVFNSTTGKIIKDGGVTIANLPNDKVKYDAGDTTADYISNKVVAGTGISVAEGTGGNENKLVVTNSAPDQTVAITAGTNITSVTGTYPNFTINADTQAGTYTDEKAQDAVGGMVDSTLVYTDGTPELKVANPVIPATVGFTITAGTTPKTLTVSDTASVSGTNTGNETNASIKTALGAATTSVDGYLTSTDWNTFNSKQPAGSYEVTTNKENTTIDTSTTKYPTINLLKTGLDGKVDKSAYDANSILYATNDNTPVALTVGEQTFVGRKTGGNISALTATEARTILNVADGAEVNVNADWNSSSGDSQILNKPSIPTQYTDELAQDAVGGILTDTTEIDFTYDDATPKIEAAIKSASITYAKIQNVSATDRILGRDSAGAGSIEEITPANLVAMLKSSLVDLVYPVGSIYETTSTDLDTTTKMGTYFGGTWEDYGSGRVLVGKSADTEFDTIGETGGAKTHTLATTEIPSHTHTIAYQGYVGGSAGDSLIFQSGVTRVADYIKISSAGGGGSHNNLQPYIVVYRYRRTA